MPQPASDRLGNHHERAPTFDVELEGVCVCDAQAKQLLVGNRSGPAEDGEDDTEVGDRDGGLDVAPRAKRSRAALDRWRSDSHVSPFENPTSVGERIQIA